MTAAMASALTASTSTSQDPLVTPKVASTEDHYTQYLDPDFPIDDRLKAAFRELKLSDDQIDKIQALLGPIRVKHRPTYEHCLRVGLLSQRIGSYLHANEKALLYAGLLHDVGKALTSFETLNKTSGWTKKDQQEIEKHVEHGVQLLGGSLDFTADSLKFHHRYQPNGYPKKLPPDLHNYGPGSRLLLQEYGRIVAIADTFDALHRINDKHGEKRGLSGEEIRNKMLQFHRDRKGEIEGLFRHGILTTFILGEPAVETIKLNNQNDSYQAAFRFNVQSSRDPRNTQRHIQQACVLAPLSNMTGATNRFQDASDQLSLEHYSMAGINIGEAFQEMAQAINDSPHACPKGLYQYALRAQEESRRNRGGGPINHGIIELLTPIVAAQHLHDPRYKFSVESILAFASDYLAQTDRSDVKHLRKMRGHAEGSSNDKVQKIQPHHKAQSVKDYYEQALLKSENETNNAFNREFLNGFPTVLMMSKTLQSCPYAQLHLKVEEAAHRARAIHHQDVGVEFMASCLTAAIYLDLSQSPMKRAVG